jgi:hypothetical protein
LGKPMVNGTIVPLTYKSRPRILVIPILSSKVEVEL